MSPAFIRFFLGEVSALAALLSIVAGLVIVAAALTGGL